MTRHLELEWPDPRPFAGRKGEPIRLLAVSDELDPALGHDVNRERLGRIDMVIGCGDLGADELCFLGDAFGVPLIYVLGNHDRGGRWAQSAPRLPTPLARFSTELGLGFVGLSWPGHDRPGLHARRDERAAWVDVARVVVRLAIRRLTGRAAPVLVVSHAPPRGLGDGPDAYHRGFAGYRWLVERLRPPVWLHGHTNPASTERRDVRAGPTRLVNVTGSVLIELRPPSQRGSAPAGTSAGPAGQRPEPGR
ncbi:MAG TPA: metallophosphoesterase [Candidatus Dormibacteraeota bacterium]|nr:metallophosphoesterase [Candidatus Dormibacteraeota bacterium]